MSKKYIDIEGLRHIVNRLYNRDFDGMGLSHIDFTEERNQYIESIRGDVNDILSQPVSYTNLNSTDPDAFRIPFRNGYFDPRSESDMGKIDKGILPGTIVKIYSTAVGDPWLTMRYEGRDDIIEEDKTTNLVVVNKEPDEIGDLYSNVNAIKTKVKNYGDNNHGFIMTFDDDVVTLLSTSKDYNVIADHLWVIVNGRGDIGKAPVFEHVKGNLNLFQGVWGTHPSYNKFKLLTTNSYGNLEIGAKPGSTFDKDGWIDLAMGTNDEGYEYINFANTGNVDWIVTVDLDNLRLRMQRTAGSASAWPSFYLIGDATPGGWTIEDGVPMLQQGTYGDAKYRYTAVADLVPGEFKISKYLSANWDADNFLYRDPADETKFIWGTSTTEDTKWTIEEAGTYSITIDLKYYNYPYGARSIEIKRVDPIKKIPIPDNLYAIGQMMDWTNGYPRSYSWSNPPTGVSGVREGKIFKFTKLNTSGRQGSMTFTDSLDESIARNFYCITNTSTENFKHWTVLHDLTADEKAAYDIQLEQNTTDIAQNKTDGLNFTKILTYAASGNRKLLDKIFTDYPRLSGDMLDLLEAIKPGFKVAWGIYKAWNPNTTNAMGAFEGREDIIFMPPIDVSHVTNAAAMFKDCINLKEVGDLNFKSCERFWSTITKSGWLYCDLFKNCPSLEEIGDVDISGLVCDKVRLAAPNASGSAQYWGYLTGWWRVNGLFNSLPSLRKFGKLTFPADKSFTDDNGIINNFSNTSFTTMFAWSGIDLSGRFQELMPPYHCYSLQGYYSGVPGSIGTIHVRTHMAIQLFYCKYDVNGATVTFDDPGQYAMKPGTLQVDEMFAYTNAIAGGVSVDLKYATNMWGFIDGSTGFTASDFLNIGTQPGFYINLRSTDWGVIGNDKSLFKYRLTNNLYKNSFNRAAAGYDPCTINLSEKSYSALTSTEIANITAKGYTLTT